MIRKVWGWLRSTFTRGLVILVPVVITFYILNAIFVALDQIISPILRRYGVEFPGLGFATMVLLILVVGLLSGNLIGNILLKGIDGLMRRIPIARTLYSAIKEVLAAFSMGKEGKSFRSVVVVEYPRKGIYSVGFATNNLQIQKDSKETEDVVAIYFPHPPNPTSGVLVFVPRRDVHALDMSVEEGLKLALSAGIVAPEAVKEKQGAPHPSETGDSGGTVTLGSIKNIKGSKEPWRAQQ
jgi:uncharacterized membrane protein